MFYGVVVVVAAVVAVVVVLNVFDVTKEDIGVGGLTNKYRRRLWPGQNLVRKISSLRINAISSFLSDKVYFSNISNADHLDCVAMNIILVIQWASCLEKKCFRNSCSHLHFANVLVIIDIFANSISPPPKT